METANIEPALARFAQGLKALCDEGREFGWDRIVARMVRATEADPTLLASYPLLDLIGDREIPKE